MDHQLVGWGGTDWIVGQAASPCEAGNEPWGSKKLRGIFG